MKHTIRARTTIPLLFRSAAALFVIGVLISFAPTAQSEDTLLGFLREDIDAKTPDAGHDVEQQAVVHIDFTIAEQALLTGRYANLQLFDSNYLMSLDQSMPGSPGVVTHSGKIYDPDLRLIGSILLTSGEGRHYGLIRTHNDIYQLFPSDHSSAPYLLQKMRPISAPGMGCFDDVIGADNRTFDTSRADSYEHRESEFKQETTQAPFSATETVDVLVLYTPSVSAPGGTGNLVNWVNTIVASYNDKIAELGTTAYPLSLKAVVKTSWPTFSTPYHGSTSQMCLYINNNICDGIIADQHWVSTDSTVAGLRNAYSADLVVLITANSVKHPNDEAHGFAGLKRGYGNPPPSSPHAGQTHGDYYSTGDWGEFVTVRDEYALSNLTFHHEVGHAFSLKHAHGVVSFGYTGSAPNWIEQSGPTGHLKPMTIMGVNLSAQDPICLWSSNTSSSSCHMRMPYFAHQSKFRKFFISGWLVPRFFDPKGSPLGYQSPGNNPAFSGLLMGDLEEATAIVSPLR